MATFQKAPVIAGKQLQQNIVVGKLAGYTKIHFLLFPCNKTKNKFQLHDQKQVSVCGRYYTFLNLSEIFTELT